MMSNSIYSTHKCKFMIAGFVLYFMYQYYAFNVAGSLMLYTLASFRENNEMKKHPAE